MSRTIRKEAQGCESCTKERKKKMGRVSELQIREAIANFKFTGRLIERKIFGSGHINDTYLLFGKRSLKTEETRRGKH